jgi:hypothetical protein
MGVYVWGERGGSGIGIESEKVNAGHRRGGMHKHMPATDVPVDRRQCGNDVNCRAVAMPEDHLDKPE